MVGAIFDVIAEVLTEYVSAITNVFEGVINIFYQSDTGLTLMGTLLLIGIGVGIVVWAFNLVKGLIRF